MPSNTTYDDFDNQALSDSVCESFKSKLLNNDLMKVLLQYMLTSEGYPAAEFIKDMFVAFAQPIGSVVWLPQVVNIDPIHGAVWLECDGSQILKADYDRLYKMLSKDDTDSSWDGETGMFKLPDLRGKFPMGRSGSHVIGDADTGVGGADLITPKATVAVSGVGNAAEDGPDQLVMQSITIGGIAMTGVQAGASFSGEAAVKFWEKNDADEDVEVTEISTLPPYLAGAYYILAGYKVNNELIKIAV
jgi:hypothetical protein